MADSVGHITYEDAGVDTAEGARAVDAIKRMVKETARPEVIGGIGGFGGLFSAAALKDMEDPILISGTDGVGTKLVLAQLLDRHDTVGQDLVAMCVNDILASGAEPLFFLDYVAIGHIEAEHMAKIISGVAEGCKLAGCALIGGEMAEHPGVMRADDYDLAGFTVGVVDRPKMLQVENVQAGDVILGLASSGIHSNGYSLVRRVLGVDGLLPGTPEAEAKRKELEQSLAEIGGSSLADALLAPTRIYVRPVLDLLRSGVEVHALAHITGGGISENLNRALPGNVDALVNRGSKTMGWDVPPIITYIADAAQLSLDEACRTFNMGAGLMLIVAPEDEARVSEALSAAGEQVFRAGVCVDGTGEVRYTDQA
ncbi:phosphoribosylformylglycinamidine cyclo-ligase [Collinsella sp. AGMB00827]|uniref:Phosphoribosylformylglycinamidine cyclo-ligase n=1 Tax=Collinsella ureilytica TaxID=2869515 RepID=A0ABS7MK79_9ACTN|nr:phosphoribosylformylglycinamidine cyclo-ligase [Collinsella urealyticum]MBY4797774.1 phosphoribosylformylglycinamidine cyclo-ligase [Collinsella urealyticum]